jgi:hypothetical protein
MMANTPNARIWREMFRNNPARWVVVTPVDKLMRGFLIVSRVCFLMMLFFWIPTFFRDITWARAEAVIVAVDPICVYSRKPNLHWWQSRRGRRNRDISWRCGDREVGWALIRQGFAAQKISYSISVNYTVPGNSMTTVQLNDLLNRAEVGEKLLIAYSSEINGHAWSARGLRLADLTIGLTMIFGLLLTWGVPAVTANLSRRFNERLWRRKHQFMAFRAFNGPAKY